MNNNDLIRRGDVLQELDSFLAEVAEKMSLILEQYGACANRAVTNCEETTRSAVSNIRKRINAIPAVPPMSAVEFIKQFSRMCSSYPAYGNDTGCKGCPLEYDATCDLLRSERAEHFVEVTEKWAQEHPEEAEEE